MVIYVKMDITLQFNNTFLTILINLYSHNWYIWQTFVTSG